MACDVSSGRKEPCKNLVGGLKAIYFLNYNRDIFEEFSLTNNLITSLTINPSTPLFLFKYELRSSGHNLEDANEVTGENGTVFSNQTITAILKKISIQLRSELQIAAWGRPHVIVEDYNGNFLFVGIENGCNVQITQVTGSSFGELSGYNLTITALERKKAYFVDPAIINDDVQTTIRTIEQIFTERVLADGGVVEAEECIKI